MEMIQSVTPDINATFCMQHQHRTVTTLCVGTPRHQARVPGQGQGHLLAAHAVPALRLPLVAGRGLGRAVHAVRGSSMLSCTSMLCFTQALTAVPVPNANLPSAEHW